MAKRGILIVVSGFSGSGKGTLMQGLLAADSNLAFSVSATTREPRPGEIDGKDYHFVSQEDFEEMIRRDELFEHAFFSGHHYGTPRPFVEKMLESGRDVVLEIDIQGGEAVRRLCPDALLIFITPPSARELARRLVGRGTETREQIISRLSRAKEEVRDLSAYDYILINGDQEEALQELIRMVELERMRCSRQKDFIEALARDIDRIEDYLGDLPEN